MKIRMAQLFTTHMLPGKHMYIPMEACMHMLPRKRMYIPMVLCIPMRMAHGHYHHHENTKAVLNRLSRAIGHLESIKRMVEDGRDCSEVLIQLSAVKSAINNTGKVILEDHIKHCLVDAIESGDMEAIEELNKAIDRFIK